MVGDCLCLQMHGLGLRRPPDAALGARWLRWGPCGHRVARRPGYASAVASFVDLDLFLFNTTTPIDRAMLHMVALLTELEPGLIAERTRAGVKAAQAKGVKFGRKPKLSAAQVKHARKQIEQGERVQDVAALLNVGRMTLYRALQRA